MPLPEREIIRRVRSLAAQTASTSGWEVATGIGDDCAVLRSRRGSDLLVTTDFSLEGVHFRQEWHPPESVGHRCLARALSDIAAMGGDPRVAFLSLALPASLPQNWVERFLKGFLPLAQGFKVSLAGGDTAESKSGILADVILLGSVPQGRAVLRSGAKPGDLIYVTGELGTSASVLHRLFAGEKVNPSKKSHSRHFYPQPRVAAGQRIREKGLASAMIDTSDGLSTDLSHICEESGVSAVVYAQKLPIAPEFCGGRDREAVLHAGEDYELLFTARAARRVPAAMAGVAVTQIGEIVRAGRRPPGIMLMDGGRGCPLQPRGWQYFSRRPKIVQR